MELTQECCRGRTAEAPWKHNSASYKSKSEPWRGSELQGGSAFCPRIYAETPEGWGCVRKASVVCKKPRRGNPEESPAL
jgi:hypothetical protein